MKCPEIYQTKALFWLKCRWEIGHDYDHVDLHTGFTWNYRVGVTFPLIRDTGEGYGTE